MDKEQIRDIFIKNLSLDSLDDSFFNSQKQVCEQILAELVCGECLPLEYWNTMLSMNIALSRLGYFATLPQTEVVSLSSDHIENLAELYKAWQEALLFLYENYETSPGETIREYYTKSKFKEDADKVKDQMEEITVQLATTDSINLYQATFDSMRNAFELALHSIIGHYSFTKFSSQANQALAVLRRLAGEIDSNKSRTVH